MTKNPRPTRAEATDVANLVLDGADCILLGTETFRGRFPIESVNTVSAICSQSEALFDAEGYYYSLTENDDVSDLITSLAHGITIETYKVNLIIT